MKKVYLKQEHCSFESCKSFNPECYAFCIVSSPINNWLEENCFANWQLKCENLYTWEVYHRMMHEFLDEFLNNSSAKIGNIEKTTRMSSFLHCKPYIEFNNNNHALMFKLIW